MDALFNPLTPIEATFLRKLKFKWKSIFMKEEMATSFNFSSYKENPRKLPDLSV